ncbi:ABC transporter substrate-binding protein [Actinoalloteichus hymeniacidonis]|uniref:Amino acid/amide ABC transporter substrate-binding protein, HAAT family n=1 Tax=Actinoalloteichus hymeniacidonis TaxID=340345 RepID=A0AAC9MYT4_9PSEU|nr:ABC transporter substrate-binding protein [Actinoalloteichus hymeniacidonis]AOS63332.1 amino acid/amide ABC transporter substrate-binding protein, HAAT family [Actinoalloteichus hymeniacidonis]MBB5908629.1 ABC-type branched-subunit amino acid transport system substrate-binding protein [Actinoalloteichus hymeniacidonis]
MSSPGPRRTIALLSGLALLFVAGCSTAADDRPGGSSGLITGPGITDTTIQLGALTDLTGPYAALSSSIVNAQQLAVDEINEAGGICGRSLEMVVRDHGYDVQQALGAYTEIGPTVAAMPQLLGSPILAALLDDLAADEMLTFPQSWDSTLLGRPEIQIPGNTYDVDMINAIDFLVRGAHLAEGDAIGHVYFENEYGENALRGAEFAAESAGVTIVEQRVSPTDQDMTAQVAALRAADVTAVLLSAGPAQTASFVGVAAAGGWEVPVVGNTPAYASQLLETAVAPALTEMFFMVSGAPAASSEIPGVQALVESYRAAYPDADIDGGVLSGYGVLQFLADALRIACEQGDLSRAGIIAAHRTQGLVEGDLGMAMDFSDPDRPPSFDSYVLRPEVGAAGGLVQVEPAGRASTVDDYVFPPTG